MVLPGERPDPAAEVEALVLDAARVWEPEAADLLSVSLADWDGATVRIGRALVARGEAVLEALRQASVGVRDGPLADRGLVMGIRRRLGALRAILALVVHPAPERSASVPPMAGPLLSTSRAARSLGIGVGTLSRMAKLAPSDLPGAPVKVGTGSKHVHYRWNPGTLAAFLAAFTTWDQRRVKRGTRHEPRELAAGGVAQSLRALARQGR